MVWEFGYPAACFLQSITPGTILMRRTQSHTIHQCNSIEKVFIAM